MGDVIEVPLTASLKMRFAWVPPGTSWLGGGGGKLGQEQFTLAKGLWCGVYPVTQAEWQAIMGDNPSHFKNKPRHPVEQVSWNRVQQFLITLNGKDRERDLLYRLPTEQEWEYICRGGPISQDQSKYHFYFARSKSDLTPAPTNDLSSTQANFDGNHPAGSAAKGPYRQATCEVGLFLPNPLGIYDCHGNVWEWTSTQEDPLRALRLTGQDLGLPGRGVSTQEDPEGGERSTQEGSERILRGGGWDRGGVGSTASLRRRFEPGYAYCDLGFRLLAVPVGG